MEERVSWKSLVLAFLKKYLPHKNLVKLNSASGISVCNCNSLYNCYLLIIRPRSFYQRNNFDCRLLSFHRSAVLSHFEKRRFRLIIEIGGFVSFKYGCFVLLPLFFIIDQKMFLTVGRNIQN